MNKQERENQRLSEALSAMEKRNEELTALIENSYDGIFIADGNGVTTMVNRSYERITGLSRENLIGRSLKDLVAEGVISRSASLEVLQSRRPVTIEQTFQNSTTTALVSSGPVFDASGNIVSVVTNVRDMTELYELKFQLASKEELAQKYHSEIETIKAQLMENAEMIAVDRSMLATLHTAKRVAAVDTTVLLLGETGVGKEELAKYIHKNSPRAGAHFIRINCGAIPEHLLESELFGYEKGAFTGANREGKMGLFQVADGGTVFLDEIGELPLEMQVKLLRVLQEREIEKVGGTKPIPVDVRILAATNRALEELVADGRFREDLYYRINVVPIRIPPLRDRVGDIPHLAQNFLDELNRKYGFQKSIASSAMGALIAYRWPGNVRELKNLIERAVILSSGNQLSYSDFSLPAPMERPDTASLEETNLKEVLERLELDYMERYYAEYQTVRKAAAALGMDAATFVRKRKQYKARYSFQID